MLVLLVLLLQMLLLKLNLHCLLLRLLFMLKLRCFALFSMKWFFSAADQPYLRQEPEVYPEDPSSTAAQEEEEGNYGPEADDGEEVDYEEVLVGEGDGPAPGVPVVGGIPLPELNLPFDVPLRPGQSSSQSAPSAFAVAGDLGFAQASPEGSAVVAPGGVGISSPTAEAVAGAGGVAVVRPVSTAHAGAGGIAIAAGVGTATSGVNLGGGAGGGGGGVAVGAVGAQDPGFLTAKLLVGEGNVCRSAHTLSPLLCTIFPFPYTIY